MYVNDKADALQATKNDSRITPVGAFLRRTSMDELPQFLNVLMGNMSVVGPRPHMLSHTEQYSELINNFLVRHYAKPGITGWAQVNGFRGEDQGTGRYGRSGGTRYLVYRELEFSFRPENYLEDGGQCFSGGGEGVLEVIGCRLSVFGYRLSVFGK